MRGVHLSEEGQAQANRLIQFFAPAAVDWIYCSPMERAIETAQPLSKARCIDIETDPALAEIDFGEWTGKRFDELENDHRWKLFHSFRNGGRIPGGEMMVETQLRMVNAIERYHNRSPRSIIAVFSHNDPIKAVLAYYLGISLDLFIRMQIDTASVSILQRSGASVSVHGINLGGSHIIAGEYR
jgi:probable phosphoglycerate mutase